MVDIKSIPRSEDGSLREERWTKEEAERRMRELLAGLPPPPPIEELARQQGVRLPQRWEDLPRWKTTWKRGMDSTSSSTSFGVVNSNWSSGSDAKTRIFHKCL